MKLYTPTTIFVNPTIISKEHERFTDTMINNYVYRVSLFEKYILKNKAFDLIALRRRYHLSHYNLRNGLLGAYEFSLELSNILITLEAILEYNLYKKIPLNRSLIPLT